MGLGGFLKGVARAVKTVVIDIPVAIGKAVGKAVVETVKAAAELVKFVAEAPAKLLGRPQDIILSARDLHGIQSDRYYYFGFAGYAKVGKSTFINALRGIRNKEPGAAQTNYTECTMKVSHYDWAELPYVKLTDIPGCGTETHKSEHYFKENGLGGFDFLIILVGNTLGSNEIALAKNSQQINQPVCFVRSKLDQDLQSAVDVEGEYDEINQENANSLMNKIKTALVNEKNRHGLSDVPLFCISSITMLWIFRNHENVKILYEEKELLTFMKQQIAKNRG